jgi:hypothetical protein
MGLFNRRKAAQASISDGEGRTAPGKPEVRYVTRLSPEVYRKFVQGLPGPVIDKNASDAGCDAAMKLGIQLVLAKLRDELVVE